MNIWGVESPVAFFAPNRSQTLEHHRNTLAAADTRAAYAITLFQSAQRVDEVRRNACTGCSERMPERDGAAIEVALFNRQTQLFLNGEPLRCKRLVHIENVDVVLLQSCFRQCLGNRRGRTMPMMRLKPCLMRMDSDHCVLVSKKPS